MFAGECDGTLDDDCITGFVLFCLYDCAYDVGGSGYGASSRWCDGGYDRRKYMLARAGGLL